MSSFEPSERADEVEAGEEVAGGLLVARGDGSEMLDDVEEAFDEVALTIEGEVAIALAFAVRFWRDDRANGAHLKALDEAVCVISLVSEERFGLDLGGECFSLGDIVNLAAGETDRQRISQSIDDGVDFGGETAARTAYGLVDAVFFRAPTLC